MGMDGDGSYIIKVMAMKCSMKNVSWNTTTWQNPTMQNFNHFMNVHISITHSHERNIKGFESVHTTNISKWVKDLMMVNLRRQCIAAMVNKEKL